MNLQIYTIEPNKQKNEGIISKGDIKMKNRTESKIENLKGLMNVIDTNSKHGIMTDQYGIKHNAFEITDLVGTCHVYVPDCGFYFSMSNSGKRFIRKCRNTAYERYLRSDMWVHTGTDIKSVKYYMQDVVAVMYYRDKLNKLIAEHQNIVVNHKDYDVTNNKPENIEVVTNRQNILHGMIVKALQYHYGDKYFKTYADGSISPALKVAISAEDIEAAYDRLYRPRMIHTEYGRRYSLETVNALIEMLGL